MGGSSKKGGTREVPDFLLSVNYGLCHGRVDSLNKVWIKDKGILCGSYFSRSDFEVHLPEIFGGDDAEGGVSGTLEYYPGDADQKASPELAKRFGLTPDTAPGYRGLAHLFFRGLKNYGVDGSGDPLAPDTSPGSSIYRFFSVVSAALKPSESVGWKWMSNNPYMPDVKVNVTRLAGYKPILPYREIWPIKEIGTDGVPVSYSTELAARTYPAFEIEIQNWTRRPPTAFGYVVDLIGNPDISLTQAEIDSEYVTASIEYGPAAASDWQPVPGTSFNAYTEIKLHPYWQDGGAGPDSPNDTSLSALPGETRSSVQANPSAVLVGPVHVPQDTRWLQFLNGWASAYTFNNVTAAGSYSVGPMTYMGGAHCNVDGTLGPLPDANPAWIIHECMTNEEWGKGEPLNLFNWDSFLSAAETLHGEHFGLSLSWFAQDSIDAFIQEVLDHIQAFLFLDPGSGLWTLKLLRDDYDATTLPVLDPSNCVAFDRKRRLWGETINEVVVSYTDPQTEDDATVTAYDLGNIAVQGGVISETRDYYGIRNANLAQIVAERDVRAASYPLFSARVTVDRRHWNARPGDVFRLTWPEDGITEIVVRATSVDYGKPDDREITLDVTEDIFSVERATYGTPQNTNWVPQNDAPQPPAAQMGMTLPLPSLIRAGGLLADIDAADPEVLGALLADDPANRPYVLDVYGPTVDRAGNSSEGIIGQIAPTPSGALTSAWAAEPATTVGFSFLEGIRRQVVSAGDFFMLGVTEAESEMVMLDTFDAATGLWTVARGMWDTVPKEWEAGTRVWFIPDSGGPVDPNTRAEGETVSYRLIPRTSGGVLPYSEAVPFSATYTGRPFAPFRPADAQIDGAGFGTLVYRGNAPATIKATWANRNRQMEDQVAVRWDEANATPEAGQTTVLVIFDVDGSVHGEIPGLTGTEYDIPIGSLPPSDRGEIGFFAERDGNRSLFAARRAFDVRLPGGYGYDYGQNYGKRFGFGLEYGRSYGNFATG